MSKANNKGVFFDLDGTFADTAPDLADALNKTLAAHTRPTLSLDKIRPVVSHGGKALIELGFNIDDRDPGFEDLRQELLFYYQQDLAKHTQLFPGMSDCIEQLTRLRLPWGIVTNKPAWLTDPLMQSLNLTCKPCCVVSGDTLPEKKPHPAPLLHACRHCDVTPAQSIYIGDAQRDIIAGNHAGMFTVVATYGYIGERDDPHTWDADAAITHPSELMPLIETLPEFKPDTAHRHVN